MGRYLILCFISICHFVKPNVLVNTYILESFKMVNRLRCHKDLVLKYAERYHEQMKCYIYIFFGCEFKSNFF